MFYTVRTDSTPVIRGSARRLADSVRRWVGTAKTVFIIVKQHEHVTCRIEGRT